MKFTTIFLLVSAAIIVLVTVLVLAANAPAKPIKYGGALITPAAAEVAATNDPWYDDNSIDDISCKGIASATSTNKLFNRFACLATLYTVTRQDINECTYHVLVQSSPKDGQIVLLPAKAPSCVTVDFGDGG